VRVSGGKNRSLFSVLERKLERMLKARARSDSSEEKPA